MEVGMKHVQIIDYADVQHICHKSDKFHNNPGSRDEESRNQSSRYN